MSSRYSSSRFNSNTPTPSSSSEFSSTSKSNSNSTSSQRALALARTKSADVAPSNAHHKNFTSLVKRFVTTSNKSRSTNPPAALFIPPDLIAEDMKKKMNKPKASAFTTLPRKLFQKGSSGGGGGGSSSSVKALTEVKANTRTLAMVLRSERELLNQNKEYETLIEELKLAVEGKNKEVEKLKDLCLKQREEIKALKSAILFPDVMNSQLHGLLEKQGSELQQAKHVIPTLQRQVTSLTGQLQCLADDLAEVKADKYGRSTCLEGHASSPGTPRFDQEGTYSLEFSCGDQTAPGSPDDMFLKDFNPCLTPYSAKSKEYNELRGYDSPQGARHYGSNSNLWSENPSQAGKTTKSSEYCQRRDFGNTSRAFRWSDESRQTCGGRYNTSFND